MSRDGDKIPKAHSHFLERAGCSYSPGRGWINGREVPLAALPWLPALSHHQRLCRYVGPGQGYLGAAVYRETRTEHLAGGGKERKVLNSKGCREKQQCSFCELETGWGKSDGGSVHPRIPSMLAEGKWTFRLPSYAVLPWRLQVLWWPQGTGWGILGMSRVRTKEGCSNKDISAEEAETSQLSFLRSEAKASHSVVRAASQQPLSHRKVT